MAPNVIPEVAQKAIRLTSSFEGYQDGIPSGNFDGQIMTWGDLGFALKDGSLYDLLHRIAVTKPTLFADHPALLSTIQDSKGAFMTYAETTLLDAAGKVHPLAKSFFQSIFPDPAVRQAVLERAQPYVQTAETICSDYNWSTERGFALAFDAAIQNGGIHDKARREYLYDVTSSDPELNRLRTMAYSIADASNPEWSGDVLSRKLTIALGEGTVHGRAYNLEKDFDIVITRAWQQVMPSGIENA